MYDFCQCEYITIADFSEPSPEVAPTTVISTAFFRDASVHSCLHIPMFILGAPSPRYRPVTNLALKTGAILCARVPNEKLPKNRELDQILNLRGFRMRNV